MDSWKDIGDVACQLVPHNIYMIGIMVKGGTKSILCLDKLLWIGERRKGTGMKMVLTSAAASKKDILSSGILRSSSISWVPLTTTSHRSTKGILKVLPLYYRDFNTIDVSHYANCLL